jgi:HD-GYP domain-containing protein (c-di-GMP phosphodiesterase class II)
MSTPTDLLLATARILRLAQQHPINNAIFTQPVAGLLALLKQFDGESTVAVLHETVFVNGATVRMNTVIWEATEALRKLFSRFGVHELTWPERLQEAELREFLAYFQTAYQATQAEHDLTSTPGRVRLRKMDEAQEGAVLSIDARQNVLRAFARVAMVTKFVVERVQEDRTFRTPNLRKAVQSLADASVGFESLLSGLTRFPSFQGALHFHLATVAALTLLMLRKLRIKRTELLDLVMAAMLHDVGRAFPGPGDPTSVGRRTLMKLSVPPANEDALAQAASAFEVGLSANQTGLWAPGAVARLIAVPCAFDLLTSPSTGEKPLAPDQAMRVLREQAGSRFDPFAVDLFTATMGLFPVGTTVRLTGGQLAVVLEVPRESSHFTRPMVKVVRENGVAVDYLLDLSQDPVNAIASSVLPEDEGINPPHFLLA